VSDLEAKARRAKARKAYEAAIVAAQDDPSDPLMSEVHARALDAVYDAGRAEGKREGLEEAAKVAVGFGITGHVVAERIRALKDTK
jgi:hypothetical protein